MLKSYFLVILIPLVMLIQLYFFSLLTKLYVLGSLLENSFSLASTQLYTRPSLTGIYLLIGFICCCFLWYSWRVVTLGFLWMKNRILLPVWFVNKNAAKDETSNQYYWIYRLASKIAKKLNIATPDIALDDSLSLNAKILPDLLHPPLMVLSQGLLNKLTPDEVEAVMAHELAHVAMHDTFSMSILDTFIFISVWLPVYILHLVIDHVFLFKWRDKNIGFIFSLVIVLLSYGVLSLFILNTINRRYEWRADKIAMTCVNPQSFVSALKAIHVSQNSTPGVLDWCLVSVPKPMQHFILHMFLTHPSLPSRIQAIQLP